VKIGDIPFDEDAPVLFTLNRAVEEFEDWTGALAINADDWFGTFNAKAASRKAMKMAASGGSQ
jgi:hypothetical protein